MSSLWACAAAARRASAVSAPQPASARAAFTRATTWSVSLRGGDGSVGGGGVAGGAVAGGAVGGGLVGGAVVVVVVGTVVVGAVDDVVVRWVSPDAAAESLRRPASPGSPSPSPSRDEATPSAAVSTLSTGAPVRPVAAITASGATSATTSTPSRRSGDGVRFVTPRRPHHGQRRRCRTSS